MALIQCPECGKEISNRATACIHCGCPLSVSNGGKLIAKLKNENFFYLGKPFDVVGLYDNNDNLLASFKYGETKTITINTDTIVYAKGLPLNNMGKYSKLGEKTANKSKSNEFIVCSNKETRILIDKINKNLGLLVEFRISEVDVIDSE